MNEPRVYDGTHLPYRRKRHLAHDEKVNKDPLLHGAEVSEDASEGKGH